ncbi:TPA: endonuclease [Candidatus Uhrbacteria bacterium]|nr:endonuclease [Candidatus Uhrbacteria bacterium]
MFTVYILKDERGELYKGVTKDINRRLLEHKRGHTKTTRKMKNNKVVYSEEFISFEEARVREKYLKTAAGRRYL